MAVGDGSGAVEAVEAVEAVKAVEAVEAVEAIEVVFEDNHVICAVKPQGMLSQADATGAPDMLSALRARIKAERGKPGEAFVGLVHRLDRPVGGIMVFAKTSKAAARLSAQIRERRFEKTYRAVVEGCLPQASGRLEHVITKHAAGGKVSVSEAAPCGQSQAGWAALEYSVLAADAEAQKSLVEIKLITGRPHQIRAQFAHIGHPVSGDRKYFAPAAPTAPNVPTAPTAPAAPAAPTAPTAPTVPPKRGVAPPKRGEAPPKRGIASLELWPALWATEISFERTVGGGRIVAQATPPCCYPWSLFKQIKAYN